MQENTFVAQAWNPLVKLIFRFFCVYFLIYLFPFPLNHISFIWDYIAEPYGAIWDTMIDWTASNVLDISEKVQQNQTGSGDSKYHYVTWLVNVLLTVPICVIWSALDWKRPNYERLYFYLEILVRYSLAITLINYGVIKILKTQFPSPGPWLLMQDVGNLSPMGLAWLFMGYSPGFNLFTGLGEALGGVFILYRRTRLLGLFLALAVMTNVVVMNFCYDIPVKIYSLHLLLMIVLLLLRDGKRIINFLVLNRAVGPRAIYWPQFFKKYKWPILVAKILLIGFIVYPIVTNTLEAQKKWGDKKEKPSLYGIYEVEEFTKNNIVLPPLLTDAERWRYLVVQWEGHVNIKLMNEETKSWAFKVDTVAQSIEMHAYQDSSNINGQFSYDQISEKEFLLEGVWKNDSLSIKMRYKAVEDFKLLKREFHWVNERPYH